MKADPTEGFSVVCSKCTKKSDVYDTAARAVHEAIADGYRELSMSSNVGGVSRQAPSIIFCGECVKLACNDLTRTAASFDPQPTKE